MRKYLLLPLLALATLVTACPKKGGGYLAPAPAPAPNASVRTR
jgi:predicted small lipoprotein YifL